MSGIERTSKTSEHFTPQFSNFRPTTIRSRVQKTIWKNFPGILLPTPALVISRLMDGHGLTALSAAVAKGGTVVFSEGFGYADPARGQKATANSLFRIASNSKAITATAIHMLAERGRLSLSERVFGPGAILGTTYGSRPYTNWLVQIEVRHLLEHSAGGWSNAHNDPMYQPPTLNHHSLIGATLDADLLERPPGTTHIYSNFGYCLLGRIIERKTGESYEGFVRRSVLAPAGAGAMRIGRDRPAERAPNEVVYTAKGNASPYSLPVRRMDSHGGWIGSASDYTRFLLAIDGSGAPPDLLSRASVKAMRTRSTAEGGHNYGHGVGTDGTDVGHNGSLTGSRCVMWGGTGGDAWCVICTGAPAPSGKKKKNDPLLVALAEMMWKVWHLV
ncbi:MAG TPA: serine hydrolase domain-containing protein [Allosphingosinicella sp.]